MMLSSSAVDRVWGDRLGTTARLIAVGHLESAAPNAAQGLDHNQDGGEGQRGHRHGGREEERGTPIQILTIPLPHARVSIHGLELLVVLRISMPTPRGQEAQLDQVVETHRIAREARIDYASRKEEDDQDQFSSCVPTYLA